MAVLAITIILNFVPWEQILKIEVRSDFICIFSNILAWFGLFALLCTVLIILLRYGKWFSGLAMLIMPMLLFPLAFIGIFATMFPDPNWKDQTIYKNGSEYLIMQKIVFERDEIFGSQRRIIITKSAFAIIRKIDDLVAVDSMIDNIDETKNTIIYRNKRWLKVKN